MSAPRRISDSDLLRVVLANSPVRIAVIDRTGRFILDPDPNPVRPDHGAPTGGNLLEMYKDVPGLSDAVMRAFGGEVVELTRRHQGAAYTATYTTRFLPIREIDGEVSSVVIVTLEKVDEDDTSAVEQELASMQAKERRLFNADMIGLIYWRDDGAISDANTAFLTMLGYTRDDLLQGLVDWRAMTPPEFAHLDDEALRQMQRTGSCLPFEKQYVRKDGRRIDVLLGASTLGPEQGGVAFVLDVSQRKRDEHEHREAEERLRRVVDAAPIVLWSNDASGKFTLSTGRGLAVLGLSPGQVVGQSVFDVYAGFPEILELVRQALAGADVVKTIDVNGAVFEASFSPMHDSSGAVTGLLGVALDVTARKRSEAEQARLQAQLLQAQKLESLGLLAGGIAHDFNNILTPILGAASAALLTLPSGHPARDDIETVVGAARRAASLTRQMLAYSGKAQVEIRPVDLSAQVGEIASLLEASLPKKVHLRLDLKANLPAVEADVTQLQQIAMNLVINGAEAIGDREGTVLVTTGSQDVDEPSGAGVYAGEQLAPGDYVFLEVHDTGHGMDQATQEKIFDPFFTTKFTGRGLGLAAVRGIVRAHGGAIKVDSAPERGTKFKVLLPATHKPVEREAKGAPPGYRGQGLVLVIEDDAGVRRTIAKMLERFGFTVVTAEDGVAGVRTFAQHATELMLVICDMTMPRMSGDEAFQAIRRIRSDVPVILTSGYNESEATRRFTVQGLAGFLEKPFTPSDLAAKLTAVLPPPRTA